MYKYTSNITQSFKPFYAFNTKKTDVLPNFNPIFHCSTDYIEIPGGSDSVPYTDEEGNNYEIPLGDLIDYDGDDGEIQYTKSKKQVKKYYMQSVQLRNRIMTASRVRTC